MAHEVVLRITEVRIHADEVGRFHVPPEYRNDVTYAPNVKALVVELYSEVAMSNDRIAAFLNAANSEQPAFRTEASTDSVRHSRNGRRRALCVWKKGC